MILDPLDVIYEGMSSTGIPTTKYAWAKQPEPPWLVVGVDGDGGSLWADSRMTDQVMEGTVDLFCREDGPALMRTVQDKLQALGWPWELYLVQYESDTRLIHYQWVWRR